MRGVGFAIAIGVLHDGNAVTTGAASVVAAIIDALGDPHATGVIEVDVGGVVKVGRGGPDRDFEIGGEFELGKVDHLRLELGLPGAVWIFGGADRELDGGFRDLAVLLGSTVIQSDLGRELDGTLGNLELNH